MRSRHGILAPGQPMPTHPIPQTVSKPGFLTKELDWGRVWKLRYWIVGVLALIYVAGIGYNNGPSMNYLGRAYVHLWFTQPTRDGQAFVFVPANEPAWHKYLPWKQWVKRRVGVNAQGSYIFKGDNEDWSTDDRDGLKPVPPDHVAGLVVSAWTPRRVVNTFSSRGRLENRLTLAYYPTWVKFGEREAAAWSPETNTTSVYVDGKPARSFRGWSIKTGWQSEKILLGRKNGELWSYLSYTPDGDKIVQGLDSEGNADVSDAKSIQLDGLAATGGIVNALDADPMTSWICGPTKPHDNVSELNFSKPFSGKLTFVGTIVSGAVLRVSVNGGVLSAPMAPWAAETIVLQGAKSVRLVVSKLDDSESQTWKISSVEFTP